jgi:hypothetical protein
MLTKILVVYSTVLTTLLAAFALVGYAAPQVQQFDEIDVHRLNVREPDGTLRMVISNHARLPGVVVLTCPVSSDQSLLENSAGWALH